MDMLRKRSLEKIAGTSVIASGAVSLPLSFATGRMDCGFILAIWAGIAVRSGSRTGSLLALILSGLGVVGYTAVVVSAAAHGVAEVGTLHAIAAACLAVWDLLNMAMLSQLRRWPSPDEFSHSGNADAASADESLTVPKTETAGGEGDVVFAPINSSHERFPQFSLRSLFVLAILVALACAIGTQPIVLNRNWGSSCERRQRRRFQRQCNRVERVCRQFGFRLPGDRLSLALAEGRGPDLL